MKHQVRHSPEQVVQKLARARELRQKGYAVAEVCRELGISGQTYYRWRKQFSTWELAHARRMTSLEQEHASLRRMLAVATIERDALRELFEALRSGVLADR